MRHVLALSPLVLLSQVAWADCVYAGRPAPYMSCVLGEIAAVAADVLGLSSRADETDLTVQSLDDRLSTCETDVASLDGEVGVLDGRVDDAETTIADLQADVAALQAALLALQGDVAAHDAEIGSLQAQAGLYTAYIQKNNGTPSIIGQTGGWISSVAVTGTGTRVTFNAGLFPSTPHCVCTSTHFAGVSHMACDINAPLASRVDVYTAGMDGAARDRDFWLFCVMP